jgi:hypothetical protein
MRRLLRTKVLIGIGVGALAVFGVVGAFASTDTFRGNETAANHMPGDTIEQLPPQAQQQEEDATQQVEENDLGVPEDSPACERLGCDWVETGDGVMKYLPQPAVDGINRARENRERAQELAEQAQQNGLGEEAGDFGPPEGVPQGPPDWVPGPPDHAGNDVQEPEDVE